LEKETSPLCSTFDLGGSRHHFLECDVILGGIGFGGVGRFDDDLTRLDGGRPLHMKIWPLESQYIPQEPQHVAHFAKMSPLRGITSSFRVLLYVIFEF
jgi:hypothetical protein